VIIVFFYAFFQVPRFPLSILTVIGQMSAGGRSEAGEQLSKFEK